MGDAAISLVRPSKGEKGMNLDPTNEDGKTTAILIVGEDWK
ncbi:hypothetical protein [Virgibacillus salexigens]